MRFLAFLTAVMLLAAAPSKIVHISECRPARNITYDVTPPSPFPPQQGQVFVDVFGHNYTQPPLTQNDPALTIEYANATHKTMKQIDFGLMGNGALVAEVRDKGTFSPGAPIRHVFGLGRGVFPLPPGRSTCVPLFVKYADGTTWRNAKLPLLGSTLYKLPH